MRRAPGWNNIQHSTFNIQHSPFPRAGGSAMNPALMRYLAWPLVKFLVAFVIVQVIVAAMNWVQRRLLGLMQARLGLSIVGVLMLCGSFDLVHIVNYQAHHVWNLFPQISAAFIFLVAMNAENNRAQFDLPEAESELVAGYHTEYSAMKFAFFMLAEYSSMTVNCCLMVSLFFGGWTLSIGGVGLTTAALQAMGIWGGILGAVIFFV